jgi:hypothetical protein
MGHPLGHVEAMERGTTVHSTHYREATNHERRRVIACILLGVSVASGLRFLWPPTVG